MLKIVLGEFFGTMILVLFGCAVVANTVLKKTKGHNGGWVAITAGWGFGVILGVFVAQAIGSIQADINPAVTLVKIMMGGVYTAGTACAIIAAQIAGAFYGACLVFWLYKPYFAATECTATKLAVFCTAPEIRDFKNAIYAETLATTVLVFVIMSIASRLEGEVAAALVPYLIGILVWAIGLSLGGATGYAINPARDFGPRLAHALLPIPGKGGSDWRYAPVPLLAPLAGSAIAFGLLEILGIIR